MHALATNPAILGTLPVTAFVVIGLSLVMFPNFFWRLMEWGNRMRGISSSKPTGWERITAIVGVIIILGGLGLFVYLINLHRGITI
jgi:hypothetical protein